MKKLIPALIVLMSSFGFVSGQSTLFVTAPNGLSTTQLRAPNGASSTAYMRACALVLQSELAQIPATSTLTQFGFTLQSGTSGVSVPGNFTVYLQNTNDAVYLKGTSWSTAITGMTSVYANVMTIPVSAGTTSIVLNLSTPFTYTGGGLYVAFDWASNGPFSTVPATYFSEVNALNPGAATNSASSSAPSTLVNTNIRPDFLFGFANSYTNEVHVLGVEAPGRIPNVLNSPHVVSALVRNSSMNALSNIPVTMTVNGANPVINTVTISSLAAGTTTLVSFPAVNPQLPGAQTVMVTVPQDEFNGSNSATFAQSVTCDTWGRNPAVTSFSGTQVGFGSPGGIISTQFLSPVNTNMTGIRVALSNHAGNINNKVYGVLLNSFGNIIAMTNTITMSSATQNSIQYFVFPTPVALSASSLYYYGLAQTYSTNVSQYFPVATYLPTYQPLGLYYAGALTGGLPGLIPQNFGFFGLEAVFQHSVSISAPSQTVTCGATTTLNATSTTNYSWSTGATTSSIVVTPLATKIYTVVATNTMGCMASAQVTVQVNTFPINIASTPTAACVGAPINFTATGGATNYTWAVAGNTVYTNTFFDTPLSNKTYTIKGLDIATGCSVTLVYSLTVNPLPIVNLSTANPTICSGKSVTVTASGNPVSYSWSTGPTTASVVLTPASSSVFSVTGTSAIGCTNTKTVDVTVNTFTPGINDPFAICVGKSAVLSATALSGYMWSTNQSFASITVTPQITTGFTVTATGANGCTGSNATTITVNPNPTVTASANRTSICRKESAVLTASGAATYSWSSGSPNYSAVVTPTFAVPQSYTVTGTNAQGCTAVSVVTLTVNQCSGLEESGLQAFKMFPNPASTAFTLLPAEAGELEVYNNAGQLVLKQEVDPITTTVSVEGLPPGVYSVVLRSDSGPRTAKLVIQK